MVLDSKINAIRQAYDIRDLHQWQDITPYQVLMVDGVGPVTLDHLRLYLAGHDTTLKNDATPAYWRKNLASIRVAQQISNQDRVDVAPFTVLVDSMEQQPFTFQGLLGPHGREVAVECKWKALGIRDGRYYQPMGDYSIEGFESMIHIERKSVEDCQATVMAFGGRRERFEYQLDVFQGLPCSAVVVEGSMGQVVSTAKSFGEKSDAEVKKIVCHSLMAWQQDYRVPWYFCDSRRMAEYITWRVMLRFWQKLREKERQARKKQLI